MDNTHSRISMSTKPSFTESKMHALMFAPLRSDGSNFLEWVNDAKVLLSAKDLAKTLTPPVPSKDDDATTTIPPAQKWHTLTVLRRHLDHALGLQYLQFENSAGLWTQLHARFDHQQRLFLPQARVNWTNIRVLDFSNYAAYNSKLHRIIAQLRLCDQVIEEAELIEKTLSTLPPTTAILLQQYRNMKFEKLSELMSYLLFAEKHHQILLHNAELRPAREVHNTIEEATPEELNRPAEAIVPTEGVGPRRHNQPADHHAEVHVAETSKRPSRGSLRKSKLKWHTNPAI